MSVKIKQYPEDGDRMFILDVGNHLQGHMVTMFAWTLDCLEISNSI